MCIVFLTTAHPSYALILLDNRDEFILRPTSRPAWWPHPSPTSTTHQQTALSSRDLQRAEKGTWLGITPHGTFAVLTNYRETDASDPEHPVHGVRSRGGMVTYWLGTDPSETTAASVQRLVRDGGVKGVGGFSMLCGKLRRRKGEGEKNIEPVAIVSNRSEDASDVPWVCTARGEVCALSNTCYGGEDEKTWPKITDGKRLLSDAVASAVRDNLDEEALTDRLFSVLDADTFPREEGLDFARSIDLLRNSVFIPPIGDDAHRRQMDEERSKGPARWPGIDDEAAEVTGAERDEKVENRMGFERGLYGTQRQTVVLVDWEGNVTFRERALFDGNGNEVPRGEGDEVFRFKIEGWET